MKEKFYITTPIYYPSGKYHIGTAYTETLANTIKKYKEQRGYDAYLLTGTDEHGQKVEQVAIKNGKTPQEHVDDMAKEAKIQNSIKETMKDSTVIVIAQRISGVMDADKIIVMDDGKIANIGTHKELLKTSEIYRSIAVSQLGEEVLESVG